MKKEDFIKFMNDLIENGTITNEEVINYVNEMANSKAFAPKGITDKGKVILKDMQENIEDNKFTSKAIADRIGVSGRSVSGSIRSLIALGYVEKVSNSPVMYALTDAGIAYEVD